MGLKQNTSKIAFYCLFGCFAIFFLSGCFVGTQADFGSLSLSAPTGLSLSTPSASPNSVATPTITVTGLKVGGTVRLFRDNNCTVEVASGSIVTDSQNLTVVSALTPGAYVFYANQSDQAATSSCSSVSLEYIYTTAPFVQNVTSSTADGSYKATQSVSIEVTFSQIVNVTGTPRILLETGATDRFANYISGTGTNVLVFSYTVQAGDTSADLEYASRNALELNGGTITSASSEEALLTLAGLGTAQSLAGSKALVIDTTGPFIANPLSDGSIHISLTDSPNLSWPTAIDGSGVDHYEIAIGTSSGGTQILTWTAIGNITTYQVTGLTLSDGVIYYPSVRAVDILGNVGTVLSGDGWIANAAVPTISSVTSATSDGAYNIGDAISIQITFSENVTVTGTPRLLLETGLPDQYATYASTNGTNVLTFTYTVQSGDTSSDLQYQSINALELNGGSIVDGPGSAAALTLPALAAAQSLAGSKAMVIDTTAPTPPGSFDDGINTTDQTRTPWLTWTASADTGGSGIAKYEISIGSTSGATDVLNWTDVGNVTELAQGSLSLTTETNYFVNARAVDQAGNISSAVNGNGFLSTIYGWKQQAFLKAPNLDSYDEFGTSVAIFGDTAIVGAYKEASNQTMITNGTTGSSNDGLVDAGAAYIFKRTGPNWASEAYLKPPNPNSSDKFGEAVAISGDTAVVGARGESSSQTIITNGAGASADNSAFYSGAVYVFKRAGTTWAQEAYLKAPNSQFGDHFGSAIAISGDTIAVAAIFEDSNQTTITNGAGASGDNSANSAGAVYVFKRNGVTWTQEAYLKAPNAGADDNFGTSVSISGDTVVVGAKAEDSNQTTITTSTSADNSAADSGAVYVFKRTGVNWALEAYLKAANSDAGDNFGYSVAIEWDTVVVGSISEDSNQTSITNGTTASSNNSAADSGAVYVFKRTGTTWNQEAYLKSPNLEAGDGFGESVSISGDSVLVSSPYEDSNQTTILNASTASSNNTASELGAVYVFHRTGTTWAQGAYLKPPNGDPGDYFGESVSISGDTAIVGSPYESSNQTTITNGTLASTDNSGDQSGAAYVFTVNRKANWQQQAYVKASNAEEFDNFGKAIAISGDTAVVGNVQESSNQTTISNGPTASADNSVVRAGAAYVYKRSGATWVQEAYLKAPSVNTFDYFGESVAVSGDTVIVGASGEDSAQTTVTNGAGAPSDNAAGGSGAVYVFKRNGAIWAREAYLKTSNSEGGDHFGFKVAIDGDTIVAAANREDSNQTTITNGAGASGDNSANSAGAVYVFKRNGVTWSQEAYLKAPNAEADDNFGTKVSISGDTIVVAAHLEDSNQTTITNGTGASGDNSAISSGAVYVFKRNGVTWSQEAYLKAPNANATDYFGWGVDISGDTVVVGAPNEGSSQTTITNGAGASGDNSANGSGAAYVFKRNGATWVQEAYLKAPNADENDWFGMSVSISGNLILVGAPYEDSNQTTVTNGSTASSSNSSEDSGAAYVFKRTGTTWAQESYLKAPNGIVGDNFGEAVAISSTTAIVGAIFENSSQTTIANGNTAPTDQSAEQSGAVYIFKTDL